MSQLIACQHNSAQIIADNWTLVSYPEVAVETRVQAGKVVLFKLTGEISVSEAQIADTVIPTTGKVMLPLAVYLAHREALDTRLKQGEIGLWLATHEELAPLLVVCPNLNVFPLIAVFLERFADGRIFSLGTLLRTRYGFHNTLRAFGDVTRDHLHFLKRAGFDNYVLRADQNAQAALQSLHEFSNAYQGAADEPRPVWRRMERV